MDGFGLNFGCPLRLKRAIELLESLSSHEQRESREGLKSATKHLPTVEELLWLDVGEILRRASASCKKLPSRTIGELRLMTLHSVSNASSGRATGHD